MLAANLLLRPLARRINRTPIEASEHEIYYRFRCTCRAADEAHMRALLLQNVQPTPLALISWELVAAVDTENASVGSDELVRAKIA